jgi:hypothetical protein
LVGRVALNRLDLAPSVTDVLLGVEAVGLGRTLRKAIEAYKLSVDFGGDAFCPAVLRFHKAQHRQAFQCRPPLTTPGDHLDGCHGPWSRVGAVGLLTRDSPFLKELEHDVHMASRGRELLHKVFHHYVHQLVPFLVHGIDHDIAPMDRVGTHS